MNKLGVLIVVLLAFVLSACGASLSSPEGAAAYLYTALENEDKDKVKEALCEDMQGRADQLIISDADGLEAKFDLNFQYVVKDKKDKSAVVRVYGRAVMRLTTKDYNVEYKFSSRTDKPLLELTMVKEGDDWKVCSDPSLGIGIFD